LPEEPAERSQEQAAKLSDLEIGFPKLRASQCLFEDPKAAMAPINDFGVPNGRR
jgi:hypothetical protein